MKPYIIEVADRYGSLTEHRYETFEEMLEGLLSVVRPDLLAIRRITFGNSDQADLGTSGLTDEELERVAEGCAEIEVRFDPPRAEP